MYILSFDSYFHIALQKGPINIASYYQCMTVPIFPILLINIGVTHQNSLFYDPVILSKIFYKSFASLWEFFIIISATFLFNLFKQSDHFSL